MQSCRPATMLARIPVFLCAAVMAGVVLTLPVDHEDSHLARDELDYRLPKNVIPKSYSIHIIPEYPHHGLLDSKIYSGNVIIDTVIATSTNKIVFHKGATITAINVTCVTIIDEADETYEVPDLENACNETQGEIQEITAIDEERVTEKFIITLGKSVSKDDNVRIVFSYDAEYPEGGLTGFYVSTYEQESTKVAMLTTKFEPTHARKAFPCFDEPALKATFNLAITYKDGISAISNTDIANKTDDLIVFHQTPNMSTYLLAFIVYEEAYFTNTAQRFRDDHTVTFRTWGQRNMITTRMYGKLSQMEGPEALNFLESYTNISYTETLPKMDMAAIPDFQSGAMENWGLVTYRESALLYDDNSGITSNYKRVVDVIDHELCHMWFGNLVTTDWWSSIWLNEGFATYVQALIAHERYPNWHMLERFVLDDQMGALAVDASEAARPLTDPTIQSPEEIGNHFGTITYSKGAAILRQIRNVMGEDAFRRGVQKYLRDRYLDSATPEDLFSALRSTLNTSFTGLTGDEFNSVLVSWTTKSGFPLINVSRSGNTFTVTQERFLLEPSGQSTAVKYPVYLTYVTAKDTDVVNEPLAPQGWLKEGSDEVQITISDIGNDDWVLFNAFQGGYYRVKYDDASWTRLARALDEGEASLQRVSALDRAGLVDNAMALARAGHISYNRAFSLLRFLRHDTAFEPWAAARVALAHTQRLLGSTPEFQNFVAFIVEKAFNETTFEVGRMEAHIAKVHRTNVLSLACGAGYAPCLQKASELLDKAFNTDNIRLVPVHKELEPVVFCYGLKGAPTSIWDKIWDMYEGSTAARRATLISALGCIDHRDTLKKFLEYSLDTNKVRSQDANTVFSSVFNNPEGVQVALDFLTFWGYEHLDGKYKQVRNAMATLLSGLSSRLTTHKQKEQLASALQGHSGQASYLANVQANIDWVQKHSFHVQSVVSSAIDELYTGTSAALATSCGLVALCATLLLLAR